VRRSAIKSILLAYILDKGFKAGDQLPTIHNLSAELGVSVAKMREELEIARTLGIVEVKPGRGTRIIDYSFAPLASLSALYAIGQDSHHFEQFRQMRNALEAAFWDQAVSQLTAEDIARLKDIITSAQARLARSPIQVPANEHRDFHLTIFSRLGNPFVQGIMEAFWDAYEAFGFNLYFELDYHRSVWDYHEQIIKAIEAKDIDRSRRLLIEHMNLIQRREQAELVSVTQASRFE
jgi:DNA-binding FadR family transcriptional regulator